MNLLLIRPVTREIALLAVVYLITQEGNPWVFSALALAAALILRIGRRAPTRSRPTLATPPRPTAGDAVTPPARRRRGRDAPARERPSASEHCGFFELPEERRSWMHPVEETQVDTRVYRAQGRTFRLDRYVEREGYPYCLYEVAETRALVPIPVRGALEWGNNPPGPRPSTTWPRRSGRPVTRHLEGRALSRTRSGVYSRRVPPAPRVVDTTRRRLGSRRPPPEN